jgi:2-aminoadipate transaminase
LTSHAPTLRQRYAERCEAMHLALTAHLGHCCRWVWPRGGMFFWLELPAGCDASALLPTAAARGVVFVPGSAFFAEKPRANTLRLSFATERPESIARGIAALGAALAEMLEASHAVSAVHVGPGSAGVLTSTKSPNPSPDTKLQQEYA